MTLDLDRRQRAMLAEMRVPVWSPIPDPEPGAPDKLPAGTQAAAAPSGSPAKPVMRPVAAEPAVARRAPVVPAAIDAIPPAATAITDVDDMDWPTLAEAVRSCQACGLCEGRKAAVFALDPPPVQADWLVVGEAPDQQEEGAGTPFAGAAGELLDNMLRAVSCARDGQGRAGARVTNVVKCRPAVARNPQADELARCAVFLRREIALTKPKVILAMGRFAAGSLLAQDYPQALQLPFGQMRGQVYRFGDVPVVVTYHPAKLLRAPQEKANAWADLCLARSLLQAPG